MAVTKFGPATAVVLLVVALLAGASAGVGGYTFWYAEGASYLTNDPAACANCHVMNDHYNAWRRSSHHAVAVCNDCHAPHDVAGKYWTKARNGFNHSLAFTTGRFHEPIAITRANREITQQACRHCHAAVVEAIDAVPGHAGELDCLRCHANVGHALRD